METVPDAKISISFKITTAPSENCEDVYVQFCKPKDSSCTNEEEIKQNGCEFTIEGTVDKDSFIKRYETYNATAIFSGYADAFEEFTVDQQTISLEGAFDLKAKVNIYVNSPYGRMCKGSKVTVSCADNNFKEEMELDETCAAHGEFDLTLG